MSDAIGQDAPWNALQEPGTVRPWKIVGRYLINYKKVYSLILAVSILLAALEALHIALLYPILNSLLNLPADIGRLGRVGRVLDGLLTRIPTGDRLIAGCVLLIALTPLKGLVAIAYEFLIAWASGRVVYRTKKKILERFSMAFYQFFIDSKQGDLIERALISPARLAFILTLVPQLLVETFRIAAIFTVLLAIDVRVTLVLAGLGAVLVQAISLVSRRLFYTMGKDRVEAGAAQTSVFNEWLAGVKPVWLFGSKGWWLDRFDEASRRYSDLYVKDTTLLAVPKNLIEVFAVTGLFGGLLFLKLRSPQTLYSNLPLVGTFCMALLKMLPSLSNLSRSRLQIMGSLADVEGISKMLRVKIQPPSSGKSPFQGLSKSVRFDNVGFRYPGRRELFSGLELTIERDKMTAIVGDSGSGKTTLLNLLLGLYRPTAGAILINERPLGEYDLRSWLDRVAVVSQDIFVFNGTIRENILFGRTGYSDAEVREAAQVACADEFIGSLPEAYDTLIGERGMKLSGGQQQRIAIARAILGRPEVLVFDEATSSLDTVSEAAVQKAIAAASRGKTVIAIAHRLSTIQNADAIYVLHGGRVVERGTHRELMAKSSRYARFFDTQLRAMESRP